MRLWGAIFGVMLAAPPAVAAVPRPGILAGIYTEAGHRQKMHHRVEGDPRFLRLKADLARGTRAMIRDHLRAHEPDAEIELDGQPVAAWRVGKGSSAGHYLLADGRVLRRETPFGQTREVLTPITVEQIYAPDVAQIRRTTFHPSLGLVTHLMEARDRRSLGFEGRLRAYRTSVERGRFQTDEALEKEHGRGAVERRIKHRSFLRKRSLGEYRQSLSVPGTFSFGDALAALGPTQVWLDVGMGEGRAVVDYLKGGGGARVVTVDKNAPRGLALRRQERRLGAERLKVLTGDYLEDVAPETIGTVHLISDLFGALAYSPRPDRVLARYGELLAPGGTLATEGFTMRTKIMDPSGKAIPITEWLAQVKGFEVVGMRESGRNAVVLRRTTGPVHVPSLGEGTIRDGGPPSRDFVWKR